MFKFATATILASYAHSISLSLESEGIYCGAGCMDLEAWQAKVAELAVTVNQLYTGEPAIEADKILLKPLWDFYEAKFKDSNY